MYCRHSHDLEAHGERRISKPYATVRAQLTLSHQVMLLRFETTKSILCHIRFQIVVQKYHPGLYSAVKELEEEQADKESVVAQLS